MKDLSLYSYQELYDLVNHLDPFKYQDKLEAVRQEIGVRKERGEVPERLIPEIDWEPLKFWRKKQEASY